MAPLHVLNEMLFVKLPARHHWCTGATGFLWERQGVYVVYIYTPWWCWVGGKCEMGVYNGNLCHRTARAAFAGQPNPWHHPASPYLNF